MCACAGPTAQSQEEMVSGGKMEPERLQPSVGISLSSRGRQRGESSGRAPGMIRQQERLIYKERLKLKQNFQAQGRLAPAWRDEGGTREGSREGRRPDLDQAHQRMNGPGIRGTRWKYPPKETRGAQNQKLRQGYRALSSIQRAINSFYPVYSSL